MKFTATLCIAALTALVSAQAEPESSVSLSTSELPSSVSEVTATSIVASSTDVLPATSASVSLTPQESCAANCEPANVGCRADCFGVPSPNTSQAAGSNECAARCPQGSGSQADTEAYGRCQQSCFSSIFLSTGTDASTPTETGAVGVATTMPTTGSVTTTGSVITATRSGTASGTGSSAASSSGSSRTSGSASSSSSSATGAGSASASPSPANAAGRMEIGTPVAGLAGIIAAVLAL